MWRSYLRESDNSLKEISVAKVSSVNVDCVTNGGAAAVWNLVNLLISNGWTKFADSDGTTYSSSGTQVTGPGSGTNGLNNTSAWVALRDPSGASGRKYLFQRGSADNNWWIRYVRGATLNTAGNATTMPTNPSVANDLQNIHGTSSSGTLLFDAGGNYYTHAVHETTAAFGVYQFWMATSVKVTGAAAGGMLVMGLDTNAVSGGLDQDPSYTVANSTSAWIQSGVLKFWNYYGLVSPAPAWVTGGTRAASTPIATVNQYTGNDDAFPIIVFGSSSQFPYKGQGNWARVAGVLRTYPNTINLTTDAYCYFSDGTRVLLLPWPENTTPQL